MATYIEGDLQAAGKKFGIIVSRFNSFVSERLLEGALDTLLRSGAEDSAWAFIMQVAFPALKIVRLM